MTEETATVAKPWWQSLTVWSGIFAVAASFGFAGFQFDPATGDFTGNIYQLWQSILGAATGAGAVYGRIRATVKVGK